MSEFKGTKGKFKYEYRNGNYYLHKEFSNFHREYLGVVYYQRNESNTFNSEGAYNALLISKAPELLEALQQVIRLKDIIDYDESIVNESNIGEASAISQMLNRIETLIQEATELK